jgi:hypothetical protein
MTAKRRLDAIEGSLDPLALVLQVIGEAQEYAGLPAYVRAIADAPIEAAPLSRIGAGTEAAVRSTMKGRPRPEIDAAVRRAVGDGAFRYILFMRLNTAALEVADREGLRATAVFYWMGCLLGGPREGDLPPDEWTAHQAELEGCWERWQSAVANLLLKVMVEQDAREQLEARYLGGRPALFADAEAAWDRFAELVDRLSSIAATLREERSADNPTEPELLGRYDERVAARVQELADDARISTFERIGEMPRAVAIMERRLSHLLGPGSCR